tara:strand:+ start:310 stop:513 length:204 start_codon:yes stop_codon:yes gene_type:complete
MLKILILRVQEVLVLQMIIVLVQMFIMLAEVVQVHGMLAMGTLELAEMEEVALVHTPVIVVLLLLEK